MIKMLEIIQTYLPNILFEFVIALISTTVFFLFLHRYIEKKSDIAKGLSLFFGFNVLSLYLTIFSQINNEVLEQPLLVGNPVFDSLIINDQAYQISVFISNYFFLQFYLILFKEVSKWKIRAIQIITIIGIIFELIPSTDKTYSLIGGIILLIQAFMLYIPMTRNTYKLLRRVDVSEKSGFAALFLNSLFMLILWVLVVMNIAYDQITQQKFGPFWFLIWITILAVVINSYLGYLNPKWFRKLMLKRKGKEAEID